MPPGSPVADCSSRAIAAADQSVGVAGAAGVGETADQARDHGLLVAPDVDVEQNQVGVMIGGEVVGLSWRYSSSFGGYEWRDWSRSRSG